MVENVIEVRRGSGALGAVAGAVVGALVAVSPFGLFGCFTPPLLLVGPLLVAYELRFRSLSTRTLAFTGATLAVVALAIVAPVKGPDQPIPLELSSTIPSLSELCAELNTLDGCTDDARVALPSRRPTWRELAAAVSAQTRWELDYRGCGTGASLLFGSAPRSRPLLYERTR